VSALTFVVSGRVQGVSFRAWTEGVARSLGVTGWVRNRADGRVEGLAEGADEALATFVARLHEGPRAARVDQVVTEPAEPCGAASFQVRR